MKKIFNSIRAKLFITLAVVIIMIIAFFIVVNSVILETLYYYSKKESSLDTYEYIKENYDSELSENVKSELEKTALSNNFDILIQKGEDVVFTTKDNFAPNFQNLNEVNYDVEYSILNKGDILYSTDEITISKAQDKRYGLNFIVLVGNISEDVSVYIRMPVTPIQDSVQISNQFLCVLGVVSLVLGGIAIMVITNRFTKPIEELSTIATNMANLDFSKKYQIRDNEDEINTLGRNINTLSDKLEDTIIELRHNNMELEKDIEQHSKIDEMRTQFISDVSHELKTPIALIQGYAEGLVENVVTDDESKNFYAEVILDEANKMDSLVKSLLELMKLEYEDRQFNDKVFDLSEVINEVIRNSKVMLAEKEIEVEFKCDEPINVYADDFYIEQVVTNYFTNAMKNAEEVNGKKKKIKITVKNGREDGKLRVCVFNTGKNIDEENIPRLWNRFYKVDSSRNRTNGGTGIGLSLVKAIMNKYNSQYGVSNKKDGVEFYFEIAKAKK